MPVHTEDVSVKEVYRRILERDIFGLTVEQIEEGERPGWIKRAVIIIDGEYVVMRFDVQYRMNKWVAMAKYMRIKLKHIRKKHGP